MEEARVLSLQLNRRSWKHGPTARVTPMRRLTSREPLRESPQMKTAGAAHWFLAKIDAIRAGAGHDAARFEALCKEPALAREAAEKFPDDPLLYQQLQAALENEIILARCGIFLTDPPFWDEL